MRRIIWLSGLCSVLLLLSAACGAQSSANKAPVGESLYVLDTATPGTNGYSSSHIIAFHPDNLSASMILPVGLFSQDHQRIYSAVPQGTRTTITITNAQTGSTLHAFTIAGAYSTTGTPYTTSDMTTDGHWLALRATDQAGGTIALIDTRSEKLTKTIKLGKNFYLDAVAPDGGTLFLLQYLPGQNGRYYVRSYDVNASRLNDGIIADKTEINDPRMVGSALTRQMALDGSFAYTLYIDTARNMAFVHMLPLVQGNNLPYPPNIARCLDLPVGKATRLLRYYTLTLSKDGSTLYATNGALGVMAEIKLTSTVFDTNISQVSRFEPGQVNTDNNGNAQPLYNGAVLSPDNKTLYFAGARGIESLSTLNGQLVKSYLTQQAFTGIAFSADGHTLYAVHPQSGITLIDVVSGQSTQITQSPAHNPWGIVWVAR